jgi:hypothetical protein
MSAWWVAVRTNVDVPTSGVEADLGPLLWSTKDGVTLQKYEVLTTDHSRLDIELEVAANTEHEATERAFTWLDELCTKGEWLTAAGVYDSNGESGDWSEAADVFSIVGIEERTLET